MTKFVECIDSEYVEYMHTISEEKYYEVIKELDYFYLICNDNGKNEFYLKNRFEEVNVDFKFVPETEIQYVTVNGVKGILIKKE